MEKPRGKETEVARGRKENGKKRGKKAGRSNWRNNASKDMVELSKGGREETWPREIVRSTILFRRAGSTKLAKREERNRRKSCLARGGAPEPETRRTLSSIRNPLLLLFAEKEIQNPGQINFSLALLFSSSRLGKLGVVTRVCDAVGLK